MGFKLTTISRIFIFPGKPDTVDSIPFFPDTVFFETGETFGTPPDDWIKVQLANSAVEGWLKRSSGIEVADPVRPELDVEGFVRSALIAEQAFNADPATSPNFVFADYVLALAFVESNMTNLAAVPPSDAIGPLQVTVAQWNDFVANGKPYSDIFENRDRPSAQAYYASYRMRADGKAIRAAQGAAASPITLLDVFHAYLTNSPAVALAISKATAADQANSPDQFNAALTPSLVTDVFGKLQKLVLGSTQPATLGQFVTLTKSALDAALQQAFALIQQNAPDQVPPAPAPSAGSDTSTQGPAPGAAPASGLNYAAAGVAVKRRQFGDLIVARFAAAGYGKNQQIAAVANAIRESNLDPNAASTPPERSFGLFQCNTRGGLGNGFTQAQLCQPETNIAIIIKEARRHPDFAAANSLQAAVEAFVRDIERPANPNAQITQRLSTAQKLAS
jgi:tail lysozyme